MEGISAVNRREHKLTLLNRKKCTVIGVTDVLAFDVNEILLETEEGMLMIRGNNLHVNQLNVEKGEMDVDGMIDCISYADSQGKVEKGEPIFSKLFR